MKTEEVQKLFDKVVELIDSEYDPDLDYDVEFENDYEPDSIEELFDRDWFSCDGVKFNVLCCRQDPLDYETVTFVFEVDGNNYMILGNYDSWSDTEVDDYNIIPCKQVEHKVYTWEAMDYEE